MLNNVKGTLRSIVTEFSEKNVTFMAAGIAYTAFISLAPILLLLLLLVSTAGGGLEDRVVELSQEWLSDPVADVVASVFEGDASAPGASVVGLVVLIWGSLKIFRGLDTAFSEIYETTGKNSFVDTIIDALVVLFAILVAVVSTVAVTAVFATLEDVVPQVGYLTPVVLIVGLIVAFFPLYYRFPDTDLSLRHVLPGVVFAAVGWAVFQSLFQVYLAFSDPGAGGLFGGVVVVVTWLYFSGLVLLLGAVINAVLGGYASGRPGGVGEGAAGGQTERSESLSPGEFAVYLESLRRDVRRRPGEVLPDDNPARTRRRPLPADGVDVQEQLREDGDDREWTVEASWRVTEMDDRADSGESPAD